MKPHSAIVLFGLALAGCATDRGVAEFDAYRTAFQAAEQTSEAILDRLSIAERKVFEISHDFDPETGGFAVADAAYIASAGDPPATAAFRRAIRAVGAYNDALYGLSSGQTAAAIGGRLTQLSALAKAATAPAGALAVGGAGPAGAAAAVDAAVAAVQPLTATLAGFWTRAAFQAELQARAPQIRAVLVQVRDGAGVVFAALQDAVVLGTDSVLSKSEKAGIVTTRQLVANWVVMLGIGISAFDEAVTAAGDGPAGIGGLLELSRQLADAVRETRRNLAGITAG